MRSFDHANNFSIQTLYQTETRTDNSIGFKLLQDHMVPGAAHDSGERFDAPKCHPETRNAVLTNIKTWVDSSSESKKVTWLHGPAGAGKSAIAQTTAENCHKENKLGAAFFFSRLAGRNRKDGLVATIAYQICVSIPAAREYIIKNIEKNPNIFKSNLKAQFQSLVVDPINLVYHAEGASISPKLIIIDGLDECENGKDQAEIIEAVTHALSMEHGSRLRVLVVSRPELDIRQAFNSDHICPLCTRLALDDTFDPDKDIELYLRSNFQTIKRLHTLGSTLPESWPSYDDIRQIVEKSSGQFIYASTVIHYVSDPKRDPRKRLDTILNIHPENGEKPFTQLDALYLNILSLCEDYGSVASIFEVVIFVVRGELAVNGDIILKSTQHLNAFLSLEDDVLLHLANLHSIVDVANIENNGIRFYHASFHDFLVDSSRSKEFYIDEHQAHARLFFRCFDFLESNVTSGLPNVVYTYCLGCYFFHYERSNWDDSILKFICEKKILEPDNSQMKLACQTFFALSNMLLGVSCTSMLGKLIAVLSKIRLENTANENARNLIVEELFNHLNQYLQWQDNILLLYVGNPILGDSGSGIRHDRLYRDLETAIEKGNNSILNHDLGYNRAVNHWFHDLMNTTGYINQLPEDIIAKSMSRLVEGIADELTRDMDECPHPYWFMDSVNVAFNMIVENINMVSATVLNGPVACLILQKWRSIKRLYGISEDRGIDKFVQKFGKPNTTGEYIEVACSEDMIEISPSSNIELASAHQSGRVNVAQPNETQDANISEVASSKLSNLLTDDINADTTIVQDDTVIDTSDVDEASSLYNTQNVNNKGLERERQTSDWLTGNLCGGMQSPGGLLAQRNMINFLRLLWNLMCYWSGSY